jgi:hypothetical protein
MPEISLATIPMTGNPAEWLTGAPVDGEAMEPFSRPGFGEILPEYINAVETTELEEEDAQAALAMLLAPSQTPGGNTLPVEPTPSGTSGGPGDTDDSGPVQALLNERAASLSLAGNSSGGTAKVGGVADDEAPQLKVPLPSGKAPVVQHIGKLTEDLNESALPPLSPEGPHPSSPFVRAGRGGGEGVVGAIHESPLQNLVEEDTEAVSASWFALPQTPVEPQSSGEGQEPVVADDARRASALFTGLQAGQGSSGFPPEGAAPIKTAEKPRYPWSPTPPDLPDGIAPAKGAWDPDNTREFVLVGDNLQLELAPEIGSETIPIPAFVLNSWKAEELGGHDELLPSVDRMVDLAGSEVAELRGPSSPLGQALNPVQPQSIGAREVPVIRMETPLPSDKWGQDFASKIAWQVGQSMHEAQIQLNPPELGPIEVRVRVNEDQAAVHFHTQHAQVREAIEKAIPELREALSQSGLQLADSNVSHGSTGQGRNGSERTVSRPFDFQGNNPEREWQHEIPLAPLRLGDGLIDAYV